jgi:hypothetical protein
MRISTQRTIVRAIAATTLAALTGAAEAQTNSLFGNSGAVSQSGGSFSQLGSTSSRSTSGATQGRQAGGQATGTQQGGLESGGPALAETGSLGAQIGQSGFVGGRGNAESFIGGNQQTGGQQTGSLGARGGQSANFGSLQGGRGGGASYGEGGDYGGQQSQQSRNAQRAISLRPQQRLGFTYNRLTPDAIETSLTARFTRIAEATPPVDAAPPTPQQIRMDVDDQGVLTLRGTVESASARKLAEVMARLEPGVRKVVNELDVQPAN